LAITFHKEGYDQTNSVLWIDCCSLLKYPLQSLGSSDTSHFAVSSRQYLTSGLITFSYEFLRLRSSGSGVSVLLGYIALSLGNRFRISRQHSGLESESNYPMTRRHISEERKHEIHRSYPDEFYTSND